jgi:hypothetical protein
MTKGMVKGIAKKMVREWLRERLKEWQGNDKRNKKQSLIISNGVGVKRQNHLFI